MFGYRPGHGGCPLNPCLDLGLSALRNVTQRLLLDTFLAFTTILDLCNSISSHRTTCKPGEITYDFRYVLGMRLLILVSVNTHLCGACDLLASRMWFFCILLQPDAITIMYNWFLSSNLSHSPILHSIKVYYNQTKRILGLFAAVVGINHSGIIFKGDVMNKISRHAIIDILLIGWFPVCYDPGRIRHFTQLEASH